MLDLFLTLSPIMTSTTECAECSEVVEEAMGVILVIIFSIGILIFCGISNWWVNRQREAYLLEEEKRLAHITTNNLKTIPPLAENMGVILISENYVAANNKALAWIAGIKKLFGGEISNYTRLCSHARRMAHVRLLQKAEQLNCQAIYNVRYETSMITVAKADVPIGVEIIAYGTALCPEEVKNERRSNQGGTSI